MTEVDQSINPDDYWTVPQAARLLGVSPETVRTAVFEGRLPSITVWGKRLIAKPEVEAYRARTQPGGVKSTGRPKKGAAGTDDEEIA